MKIVSTLSDKKVLIEMTEDEFESIMGLRGRKHNTKVKSLVNKSVSLPNMFDRLDWINKHHKTLLQACTDMIDMSKNLRDLLPEAEE